MRLIEIYNRLFRNTISVEELVGLEVLFAPREAFVKFSILTTTNAFLPPLLSYPLSCYQIYVHR